MRKQSNKTKPGKETIRTTFKTIKYLFPIAWETRKDFFFCGLLKVIFGALTPFVNIITTPLIINELLGGRSVKLLIIYAAATVLGNAFLSLSNSVIDVSLEKYSEIFENVFNERLSRRIMELDFQLTEDTQALDQIQKAREGMDWYSGGVVGISQQLFGIISSAISIIGVVAVILINAPLLFAIAAVILIILTVINVRYNKIELIAYKSLSKLNRTFGYLGWEVTDFQYGKDIRLYGAADMMTEKWRRYSLQSIDKFKWQADRQLPLDILSSLAYTAKDFGYYIYLGILAITGRISVGAFSQMLTAGASFHTCTQSIIGCVQEIIKRTNYAYEYVKFMEYPAAIEKGSRHVEDGPHTIEFREVSFAYPNTKTRVLDGVNITLHPGEHLSVVGLNGAGKTTFIKLMCRLYDPTDGEILLDGVNIKEYDYREYMELFSPVFQDFKLFAFSVAENITLGRESGGKEAGDAALGSELNRLIGQVGLSDKISSMEKGTDTVLFKFFDENGVEPSGGEQQKIAIARALFKKAPVVILDEPTAALDPVAEYDIYRQFNTLVGGKTAVYISHRLSSCKFCDRIAVFSGGRIKEYGTHDELVGLENGVYAGMFAAQAQYYN